jgi:hypothetical protein
MSRLYFEHNRSNQLTHKRPSGNPCLLDSRHLILRTESNAWAERYMFFLMSYFLFDWWPTSKINYKHKREIGVSIGNTRATRLAVFIGIKWQLLCLKFILEPRSHSYIEFIGDTTFNQMTLAQKHLPRDICKNDMCPKDVCPEEVCLERHLPRWTFSHGTFAHEIFSQKDICRERHLPRKTMAYETSAKK